MKVNSIKEIWDEKLRQQYSISKGIKGVKEIKIYKTSMIKCQTCKNYNLGKCLMGIKNIYFVEEVACALHKRKHKF